MLDSVTGRLAAVVVVTALTAVVLLLRRRREGRARTAPAGGPTLAEILPVGARPAPGATVVQLSAAVCSPCRAAARTWQSVAPDSHVELDVEEHPDAVVRLGVWRTPTSFVFDEHGTLAARLDGVPTPAQAVAALQSASSDSRILEGDS